MSETKTMTLNLSEQEMSVLDALSIEQDLSKSALMRQALRLYQHVHERTKRGEDLLSVREYQDHAGPRLLDPTHVWVKNLHRAMYKAALSAAPPAAQPTGELASAAIIDDDLLDRANSAWLEASNIELESDGATGRSERRIRAVLEVGIAACRQRSALDTQTAQPESHQLASHHNLMGNDGKANPPQPVDAQGDGGAQK